MSNQIAWVRVYLDSKAPLGFFSIASVEPEDKNGNRIPGWDDFSDANYYPSEDSLKEAVARHLKVNSSIIGIQS